MQTEGKRLECSSAERHLGVLVNGKLDMCQEFVLMAKRDNHILGCIKHSIGNWLKLMIAPLYLALKQSHLENCVLGPPIQEGHRNIRMCPKEGNKDGERTKGPDL